MKDTLTRLERDQVAAISPFLGNLEVDLIELGSGYSRVTLTIQKAHTNRNTTVHGGVLASLLDVAVGTATTTIIDASEFPATASLHIDYIQSASAGDTIIAEGRVVKKKTRIVFVEGAIRTAGGEILARGSAVIAVRPRKTHAGK